MDLEATVGTPLGKPQSRWYGVGGSFALTVQKPLASWIAIAARYRAAGFLDGDAPEQPGTNNPSFGTLNTLSLGFVLRLPTGDVRRGTGLFLDVLGGGGFTGDLLRGAFEIGAGYGFAVSKRISLAPVARYVQVIQPSESFSGADAKIGLLGLRVSFFDKVPEPPPPDRDGDGITDSLDKCPDAAEDFDNFEDADGCPEQDNDKDGILDPDDGCPNIAEDRDNFQDDDGCLDDDNDHDGFLDADDKCPLEPEVVNGEQDDDGCPDVGLIVMEDDRIVLEERVLFDTDMAKINKRADPVLKAIIQLWRQHPEWKKVRIEGHADMRGDAKFNQQLSERRAANVRDILVKLGMKKELVIAEGFGATQLRTQGTADADHQANRRVEFVVISRDEKPIRIPIPEVPVEDATKEPATTPPAAPPPAAPPPAATPAAPAKDAVKPAAGEAKP